MMHDAPSPYSAVARATWDESKPARLNPKGVAPAEGLTLKRRD